MQFKYNENKAMFTSDNTLPTFKKMGFPNVKKNLIKIDNKFESKNSLTKSNLYLIKQIGINHLQFHTKEVVGNSSLSTSILNDMCECRVFEDRKI